jgi:hypothetical protein
MAEILTIGTGLIAIAVAVGVGSVAVEAVLRVLQVALQSSRVQTTFQPGSEPRGLHFRYAESAASSWRNEAAMTPKGALAVQSSTTNRIR